MVMLGRECRDEEVVGSFGEVLDDTLIERFPGEDVNKLIQIYRDCQKDFYYDDIKIYPGMKELILGLKERGIMTAIVTSRAASSTIIGLEKFGMQDAFDAIITCDDTDAHKPSPVPCQLALEKLGVKPEEAIMVGDSKNDIKCAHNAGVKAVLVNWTICLPTNDREGENKADWEIDNAEEIYDII